MSDLDYVDVYHMLDSLGIDNISQHGQEVVFSCPFPEHNNNDSNPSASMNLKTTAWICFGCHRQGNAISFVSDYEGVSPIKAIAWLNEAYGEEVSDISAVELLHRLRQKNKPKEVVENKIILNNLYPVDWVELSNDCKNNNIDESSGLYKYYDYICNKRGFSPQILNKFNICIDQISGRIAIPIYNLNNQLVGFKSRSISDNVLPRYLMSGDRNDNSSYGFKPCKISLEVFNANNINCGEVILCEGELNAIKLCEMGYRAIAISGSNPSQRQLEILAKHYSSILMFFDSDKAGMDCARKVYYSLYEDITILNAPEHDGDPCSLGEENHQLIKNSKSPFLEFVCS